MLFVVDWQQIWVCYIDSGFHQIGSGVVDWQQIWVCYIKIISKTIFRLLWIDNKSEFVTFDV